MSTPLIYLHIPKSAGTSHRRYLEIVYGEPKVLWYGISSESEQFDPSEAESAMAIGGHRRLSFYPKSLSALYTSVVRDPVERAVSFYNYCIDEPISHSDEWTEIRRKEQQKWLALGVDPSSLMRSIEQSEELRKGISNLQCAYLSRYEPTFEGVLKTLNEENMVIGSFEQLSRFQEFFQLELNLPVTRKVRTNTGREGYATEIYSEPGLINLLREINSEDQQLYDYIRLKSGGLYVGADNIDAVKFSAPDSKEREMSKRQEELNSWSRLQLFCKGIVKVDDEGGIVAPLMIKNVGDLRVVFSKTEEDSGAIGWVMLDARGNLLGDRRGIVKVNQSILTKETKQVIVKFKLDRDFLSEDSAPFIEFSIVNGDEWLRDEHPLNSSWSRVYV